MSGYAEMARDNARRDWLDKWVPSDDSKLKECPEEFRDQYRYTLARARCAEDRQFRLRTATKALRAVLREVE